MCKYCDIYAQGHQKDLTPHAFYELFLTLTSRLFESNQAWLVSQWTWHFIKKINYFGIVVSAAGNWKSDSASLSCGMRTWPMGRLLRPYLAWIWARVLAGTLSRDLTWQRASSTNLSAHGLQGHQGQSRLSGTKSDGILGDPWGRWPGRPESLVNPWEWLQIALSTKAPTNRWFNTDEKTPLM